MDFFMELYITECILHYRMYLDKNNSTDSPNAQPSLIRQPDFIKVPMSDLLLFLFCFKTDSTQRSSNKCKLITKKLLIAPYLTY